MSGRIFLNADDMACFFIEVDRFIIFVLIKL